MSLTPDDGPCEKTRWGVHVWAICCHASPEDRETHDHNDDHAACVGCHKEYLPMTEVFVFGSNLAGRHGKGAALAAVREHGATYGVGVGPQGRAYAIPTKDESLRTLPLATIAGYVAAFCDYATDHPDLTFRVTRVGCGLAGYHDADIAPMFRAAPSNCLLPDGWRQR